MTACGKELKKPQAIPESEFPKQLGDFLFGELELVKKPKKTKTGQFVTDEDTLSALAPSIPL